MSQIAYVENGVIVDLTPGDLEFADRLGLPLVGDEVQVGWVADPETPGNFIQPFATVGRYRFLFELFHPVEQLVLDAVRVEANALSPSAMIDPSADARTLALLTVRNAYERFGLLTQIELGDEATWQFLEACKALEVFGTDAEVADLRVAGVKANQDAPTL